MVVLVFGASGMIGNAVFRILSEGKKLEVFGTVRSERASRFFGPELAKYLLVLSDVKDHDELVKIFIQIRPKVVINCIGLIKQLEISNDPLVAIPVNTLFPHRLARLCELWGARLMHISTDCVFSGEKGGYTEADPSDAKDLYGKSKFLGEVDYPNTITLRTSTIGHELQTKHELVDWFLSQQQQCKGYTSAIFSGLPTVILAQIIRDIVILRSDLYGIYHLAGQPIAKRDLLQLISETYGKSIEIIPDDTVIIDRSLNAARFQAATGYKPPGWPELIRIMHSYQQRWIQDHV